MDSFHQPKLLYIARSKKVVVGGNTDNLSSQKHMNQIFVDIFMKIIWSFFLISR